MSAPGNPCDAGGVADVGRETGPETPHTAVTLFVNTVASGMIQKYRYIRVLSSSGTGEDDY
jgi:hypothetical protein